ncbi:SIR2 family protein [Nocardioides sp. GCM10028917]|uniref:SIR2 family protein n=1 Tax=Nocardioides sp. GCM10028917 TaxID=3273408 RepID=UPI00361006FD
MPSVTEDLDKAGPWVRVPGEEKWQSLQDSDGRAWSVFESLGLASYRSENLVVLLGLGTSLGLTGSDGKAPTMADLFKSVRTLEGFDHAAELAPTAVEAGDVEALLSACQMQVGLRDDEVTKQFLSAAEAVVLQACSFVDDTTDLGTHEAFLRKVGRRATRLARTKVFTTNYDLAIERAAEATRFTLLDGFGPTAGGLFDGGNFDLDVVRRAPDGTLQLAANVIQLYKLHGSVDWDETNDGVRRDTTPGNPVLIYPSSMKYQQSYRPPYLESMARFQMTLRQPETTVIVAGFGFNDAHVVGPLLSAVRSNVSLRFIVVDPALRDTENESLLTLTRLSDARDERILLFAGTFAEFTTRLPDMAPHDAHEAHDERVRGTSI